MQMNSYQEQLLSQAQNPKNYPNIPTLAFTNLERDIQKVWDTTYGVRFISNGQPIPYKGWETVPDGTTVQLLVLAVQGKLVSKNGARVKNEDPLARNEIVILNKSWYPDETTKGSSSGSNSVEMVLNTTKNINVKVTIDLSTGTRAPGIFVVKEDLVQEISDIFNGLNYPYFKDKPILTYTYRKKP